jgi:hypothetical protein
MSDGVNKSYLKELFPQTEFIIWEDIDVSDTPEDWEQKLWKNGYGCGQFFVVFLIQSNLSI